MVLPKLPNQLSDKELEELLKSSESVTSQPSSEIIRFLTVFNIQSGKTRVKAKLLYSIYYKWSQTPMGHTHWGHEMAKFVAYYDEWYYISIPAFTLSEDALKALTPVKKSRYKSKQWHRHFKNFIAHYNMKPGKFWVEQSVLFYLYDLWTFKIRRKRCLGPTDFTIFLRHYFKIVTRKGVSIISVDHSILNYITTEQIEQIRTAQKKTLHK